MSTRASGDFDDENDWLDLPRSADMFAVKHSLRLAFRRPNGVSPAVPEVVEEEPEPDLAGDLTLSLIRNLSDRVTALERKVRELSHMV